MIVECKIECYNKKEVDELGLEEKTFWSIAIFNVSHIIAVKEFMEDGEVDKDKSVLYTAHGDFIVDLPFEDGKKLLKKMYES